MTRKKKHFTRLGFAAGALCVLSAAVVLAEADSPAQPEAPAVPAGKAIARMRELSKNDRWMGLIEEFENEDFSAWPEAAEAFHMRGVGYLHLKDAPKAERDLKEAVERDPEEGFFWYNLAETCHALLKDDARALDAYRKAFELEDNFGWMPAAAALKAVNILLYQVRNDEALDILRRYRDEDMEKLPPYWRFHILRAYARTYAAQGREAEARVKFRQALIVESTV